MTELSFKFESLFSSQVLKENRYISNHKINSEWSLVCLWSSSQSDQISIHQGVFPPPHRTRWPEFLEICRNSTAEEILVSGTFKLMSHDECVLQREFKQLFEAGSPSTQMKLEFSCKHCFPDFSIFGTLTIHDNVTHKEYAKGNQFRSLHELSSDFGLLLDPNATYFSDVNLKCGNDSFSAHKNILCARSPVFAAMFTTQMRENHDNKVDITDISPLVLKAMLTHIYTGKTGEISVQSAGELLFAADKYQLQDLKNVCTDYLKTCMSAENVLRILVLGYLHDNELKQFSMNFICNRCEEFEILEKTVEWKNLRERKPSLAMDVLTGLVKSKEQKLKRRT